MEIEFRTKNPKQIEAAQAWLDPDIEEILYGGAKGGGKAQPLSSKILTPFGWKTMGDMAVGSVILNPLGEPQRVIAIHPQPTQDIYRVTFNDGSVTECTADHLWTTRRIKKPRKTAENWRVRSTTELMTFVTSGDKIAIPTLAPLQFSKTYKFNQIKIAPYTLGVLIGDGCLRGNSLNFTTIDDEIVQNVEADGYTVSRMKSGLCYGIIGTNLREILRSWRLYGKKSEDKFIPEYYKWASISVRKELLAGLMDTDGTVDRKKGNASFSTSSKKLAEDVCFLVRSLGGRASYTIKNTTHLDSYRVSVATPFNPFRLRRKAILYTASPQDRTFVSIEKVRQEKAQCITVDNTNSLYITDDFIVTHNSFLGASLIFGDALIYPGTQYFIAREELTDLRKFTIPTIHEVFRVGFQLSIEKYTKYNGQDNYFDLYNDSRVYLLPCKEIPSDPLYERFGSMQMTRGWIEEGGEVAEAAKSNLWLSIGRWRNEEYNLKKKLLITANPKKGWMKRDFVDPWKDDVLPKSRIFIPARATDNLYLSDDYRDTLKNQKDKVARQRLWEGSWDYDEDKDSLISFDALSDTFSNTVTKDGEKYLVVDVARLGVDTTVFSFWDGLELTRIEQFEKLSTDQTSQKLKDYAAAERIPYSHILVDENGIGGAVIDQCQGIKGFVAQSSPLTTAERIRERSLKADHSFVNAPVYGSLKSQCGWKLAELINEHKIAFAVPDYRDTIIEELTSLLRDREVDTEKKKQLRKKEDVKEELGRSPDIGDTIIMRMFFELAKGINPVASPEVARAGEEQSIKFTRNRANRSQNSAR